MKHRSSCRLDLEFCVLILVCAGELDVVIRFVCDVPNFSVLAKFYCVVWIVQNKLIALKESEDAAGLDKDQREAITKIKDVTLQLEVVRDLQKQFSLAEAEVGTIKEYALLCFLVVNSAVSHD